MTRNLSRLLLCCMAAALLLCSSAGADTTAPVYDSAYYLRLEIPEGETLIYPEYPVPQYVSWLMDVARGEMGYHEEGGGTTKYGTWAGYPTAEWCAEFLCWCVNRVDQQQGTRLLTNTYPNYSGTNVGRNWFLSKGRYIARTGTVPGWGSQWWKGSAVPIAPNGYIPQPGDWLFLSDNSAGDTSHVAMVEFCAYDAEGKVRVHVIEGNNPIGKIPDAVARNDYALDYWQILGYGTVRDLADITLRFGNSGEKVQALQKNLVAAGLLEAQYTTGQYGAITQGAISALQKQQGIAETGIANHETQLALLAQVAALSGAQPGAAP